LIYYLGDLGLQTNPDGFWELSQKGLNVLPGTCLVKKIGEDKVEKPILVVAKPTIEHPGTLLLRFQNTPSKTRRTHQDLGPEWIKLPAVPAPPESTEAAFDEVEVPESQAAQEVSEITQQQLSDAEQDHTEAENVVYVRLNRQGFLEKRLDTGVTLPIVGLPFWFVYSLLASTALNGHRNYNGRPFGYQIRLDILYFSREVTIKWPARYCETFVFKMFDLEKIKAMLAEWTDDSLSRKDIHLAKRFELSIGASVRKHTAELRRSRQVLFQTVQELAPRNQHKIDFTYIPFEVISITTAM